MKSSLYLTNKFRKYRNNKGWSQKQMAEFVSLACKRTISTAMVNQWEQELRAIAPEDVLDISVAIGISATDLAKHKDAAGNWK